MGLFKTVRSPSVSQQGPSLGHSVGPEDTLNDEFCNQGLYLLQGPVSHGHEYVKLVTGKSLQEG
jgi:hypothetical protein